MLICNSVVEVVEGKLEGFSQDELGYLNSIKRYGYELIERDEKFLKISIKGQKIKINTIAELEIIIEYNEIYMMFLKDQIIRC